MDQKRYFQQISAVFFQFLAINILGPEPYLYTEPDSLEIMDLDRDSINPDPHHRLACCPSEQRNLPVFTPYFSPKFVQSFIWHH